MAFLGRPPAVGSIQAVKLLSLLTGHSRGLLILALGASLVGGLGGPAAVALINEGLTGPLSIDTAFLMRFGGLVAVVVAAQLGGKLWLGQVTEEAFIRLQERLCRQVLATPLDRLEAVGVPRLLALFSEDARSLITALWKVPSCCINLVTVVGGLAYMGWLSPATLAVLGGIGLPTFWACAALTRRARLKMQQARQSKETLFEHYRALAEGSKELQQHRGRRSSFFHRLLGPAIAHYRALRLAGRRLHEAAHALNNTAYFLFILVLFVLAARFQPETRILVGYALAALYVKGALQNLWGAVPQFTQAEVSLRQIQTLELAPDTGPFPEDGLAPPPPAWRQLDLEGVIYEYGEPGTGFKLGPLDLSLRPGQLVCVQGANGSGKTTLVKLISGLYWPREGCIRLDGCAIAPSAQEQYREHFAVVFADGYLFDPLLGQEGETLDRRAGEYLATLELEGLVAVKNGRFSTTDLSRGQRKRLALLNAYLEDRPIYLFDEAAEGQDPQFRELFYRRLLPGLKARGKLVVVVTHDPQYLDAADCLIELDQGRMLQLAPIEEKG